MSYWKNRPSSGNRAESSNLALDQSSDAVEKFCARLFRFVALFLATVLALAVIEFVAEETGAPRYFHPAHWMQAFNTWVLYPFFEGVGYVWVCACDFFEIIQKGFELLCRWLPIQRFASAVYKVTEPLFDALLSPFKIVTGINNAYDSWVGSKFFLATGTVQLGTVIAGFIAGIYFFTKQSK